MRDRFLILVARAIVALFWLLVAYAMAAFILGNWDVTDWTRQQRLVLMSGWTIMLAVSFIQEQRNPNG